MHKTFHTPFATELFSFALAFLLCVIFYDSAHFWELGGTSLWNSDRNALLFGILLLLSSLVIAKIYQLKLSLSPRGFALSLALVFFSDWLCRSYNLLQGPAIRGEIILFSLLCLVLLRSKLSSSLWLAAPSSCLMLILLFLAGSAGRLIFSDDHATFIYRFSLLKELFPNIPFYGPLWNAGIDVRDFFATGSLNVFVLFYPLFALFPVEKIYNLVLCLVLFATLPLCIFIAARLEKLSVQASSIASLLALASSLLWYRWALKYGTMGFILTASLLPLNLSLAIRLIARDVVMQSWQAFLFVLTFSLMLLWSPSGLVFLPLIALAALRPLAILKKRWVATILVLLLAINLPWISILWSVSKLPNFLTSEQQTQTNSLTPTQQNNIERSHPMGYRAKSKGLDPKLILHDLREFVVSANPLILLLCLPGLALLPRRSSLPFTLTFAWLVFLGLIIARLKPQLEFDRMLLVFTLCACVPAAAALWNLFEESQNETSNWSYSRLLASLCGGFLLASPFSVAAIVQNRSVEQYSFASDEIEALSQAINKFSLDGRVLFSGFVLHELSGGHLAPLAKLTGKPLIASSHVHNLWRYKQVFPAEFINRGDQGIQEYMELMNVSAVFAHEKHWREYFNSRPAEYELVWQGKHFRMFKRLAFRSNYFQEGSGKIIKQSDNKVIFKLDTPNAVLRFNYLPFLETSEPDCNVFAHNFNTNLSLVALSNCPTGKEIELRSRSVFKRVFTP